MHFFISQNMIITWYYEMSWNNYKMSRNYVFYNIFIVFNYMFSMFHILYNVLLYFCYVCQWFYIIVIYLCCVLLRLRMLCIYEFKLWSNAWQVYIYNDAMCSIYVYIYNVRIYRFCEDGSLFGTKYLILWEFSGVVKLLNEIK